MEHWKRTIERANRCFMQGELVDADRKSVV